MGDDDLLAALEKCTLPYPEWNHLAHVRVAYVYASRHGLEEATNRIRESIQSYNLATGTPESIDRGYHETITSAFMQLVYAKNTRSGPHESSRVFCESHPELLDKRVLQDFYSTERLLSAEAKAAFVAPDLQPLPHSSGDSITIAQAMSDVDIQTAQQLFVEYARSLDVDLCFQEFDREVATLPGAYSPPTGRLLIAYHRDKPIGCVALRPLDDGICEMKRLWVIPSFRGKGLGSTLASAIVHEARQAGYAFMRLDTLDTMTAAVKIYKAHGFYPIDPYRHNPIENVVYMEVQL